MTIDETTIIRIKHGSENPYFLMARSTAQDKSLSFEGLGMLAYLLSKPDNWQVQISDLMRENAGRDKTIRILKELEEKHYALHAPQQHDESGRFTELIWYIYETPYTENPHTAEPLTDEPQTADPPLQNTEGENTEDKEKNDSRSGSSNQTGGYRASRGAQPPPGGATTGSEDGKAKMSEIAKAILFYAKRTSLTAAQQRKLTTVIADIRTLGAEPIPSPNELYETDVAFKHFVEWKVKGMVEWSNGKASTGKIIDAVCNYFHKNGWLAYQEKNGVIPTEDLDYDDYEIDDDKPILGGHYPEAL